jgi:Ca2+-binding RTX toxin-like protein
MTIYNFQPGATLTGFDASQDQLHFPHGISASSIAVAEAWDNPENLWISYFDRTSSQRMTINNLSMAQLNISNLVFTDGSVYLLGTQGADNLTGSNMDDRLEGMGGNDMLSGGLGNDVLLAEDVGSGVSATLSGGEGNAIAIRLLFGQQPLINKHSGLQRHYGFVVLLGFGQVQSQVDVFAANDGDMLVLEELDVAGPHEAIDHEPDEPMQVRIDHAMPFKNLTAAAVFLGERLGHRFPNPLPCKTHKVAIFGD